MYCLIKFLYGLKFQLYWDFDKLQPDIFITINWLALRQEIFPVFFLKKWKITTIFYKQYECGIFVFFCVCLFFLFLSFFLPFFLFVSLFLCFFVIFCLSWRNYFVCIFMVRMINIIRIAAKQKVSSHTIPTLNLFTHVPYWRAYLRPKGLLFIIVWNPHNCWCRRPICFFLSRNCWMLS